MVQGQEDLHLLARPFSLSTVCISKNNNYPTLETKAKASKCKILFLWLCSTTVQRYTDGVDTGGYNSIRADMVWRIQNVVHLLDRAGPLLTVEEADTVYNDGWVFLRLYTHLSTMAVNNGVAAYKVTISFPDFACGAARRLCCKTSWPNCPNARGGEGGGGGMFAGPLAANSVKPRIGAANGWKHDPPLPHPTPLQSDAWTLMFHKLGPFAPGVFWLCRLHSNVSSTDKF